MDAPEIFPGAFCVVCIHKAHFADAKNSRKGVLRFFGA